MSISRSPQSPTPTPTLSFLNILRNKSEYYYGRGGVNVDDRQAAVWYRKAADQGYKDAQFKMGWLYENGDGVEKNYEQAKAWYQKAADQGDFNAQLALNRLAGKATPSAPLTPTTETASNAPTTPEGQYKMGDNYYHGRGGVRLDPQQAVYWYRKAADQGYANAQFKLGWIYENGLGVEKNYGQAKLWYRKAADQGSKDAMAGLQRLKGK